MDLLSAKSRIFDGIRNGNMVYFILLRIGSNQSRTHKLHQVESLDRDQFIRTHRLAVEWPD